MSATTALKLSPDEDDMTDRIQLSGCGKTLWVHGLDGSTVGRFSKVFGMDVHRTATQQLAGLPQCQHCTHESPTEKDWAEFCRLMAVHHGVDVPVTHMKF